jgi:hypothetical protein
MNYTTLFNTIKTYTENDFPTTSFLAADDATTVNALGSQQINTFITQAEDRIYNTVQIPVLRKNVTGTLTAANQYLSCPDDFLAVYSVAVIDPTTGQYYYLLNKDVNFIRESYPFGVIGTNGTYQGTPQGTPKYYALFGSQLANINDLSLILGPTPDQNYPVELHYFYYPPSIVQGIITSLNLTAGGSGYVPGVYYSVAMSGGQGTGCICDITINSSGVVTNVAVVEGGSLFSVGQTLSAPASSLGGVVTTPFSVSILSINNATGTSWLGDNYSPVLLYGSLVEAYTFMKGEADMIALYEKKYQESMNQLKRLGDGMERNDAYRRGQTSLPYKGL